MTTKQLATILLLICSIFMITANLNRGFADEEQGSSGGDSGGGSNDGGGDSGGNSGGSSDSGGDSKDSGDSGSKDNSNEESSSNDSPKDEAKPDNSNEGSNTDTGEDAVGSGPGAGKGTPEEQEQAAIDDYIHDEPGIVKPYPPVIKGKPDVCKTANDICDHKPGHPKGDFPKCHDWSNTDKCGPHGPIHKPNCGKWNNWCKHDGDDWDHDHDHHHNNWCDHHDCHHHHHHSSTHFSDNHHGDVTVKVHVTDYQSNDLNDVHLIIGDVYEKNLDLSSEPDTIKVDNLDIDGGDDFAVCLANEASDEGDCIVTHASSDHDEVNVNLKVL